MKNTIRLCALALATNLCAAATWKAPEITLPKRGDRPAVACTPTELARLRAAYRGHGPEHTVVAALVSSAARSIRVPPSYPPRGGQHNQWYQCDRCQLGLKTIDDTHHQCPRCTKIYSGEPYDDVIFSRKHGRNLKNMAAAAWAYAITEEKKYAAYATQILLGYAARYRTYPYHSASRTKGSWAQKSGGHLYEQTLTEASAFVRSIAPAYDLVYTDLSEADRETIRTGLLLPMLKNIDKNKAGKSNWQSWHNAALLLGGAIMEEVSWVRRAIADPRNGFLHQMEISVTEDGMWYENSWGYHYYTLSALQELVEGARRVGIDLWSHPNLMKMYSLPIQYAMAGGLLPRFGDDVNSHVARASSYLEHAYHATRDPLLLPYLTSRVTWDTVLFGRKVGVSPAAPTLESRVFSSAGHAILRTKGSAGLTAAFTFGPYGGFHGHFDKLSFVFFGHGTELGVDPGRARSQAYRLPIHRNWYKATLSHNTVLVDKGSQKPASGTLECFAENDRFAVVMARCQQAYAGVTHRRLLCLTPTYLAVLDTLNADRNRRFDWVYHNRGSAIHCEATRERGSLDSKGYVGQEYVENVKTGVTGDPIRIAFTGPKVTTHVTMAAAPATTVRTGDGPCASVLDRVPLAMITRHGRHATFAAVIEPVDGGVAPAVTEVSLKGNSLVIRNGADLETITVTDDTAVTVMSGNAVVLKAGPGR